MDQFCLKPVLFWAPELRWPKLYLDHKPCCPFHPGESSCVEHNGWSNYFRRVFDIDGISALTCRRYVCKEMRKENAGKGKRDEKTKCTFYGYDAAVVSQAPAYVQAYWRQHGFCLTHKGGIRWKMIDDFRAQLAHGMSGLGFHKSVVEKYKQ